MLLTKSSFNITAPGNVTLRGAIEKKNIKYVPTTNAISLKCAFWV